MKQFSLILNIILLLAVAYLYFHEFGGKKKNTVVATKSTAASDKPGVASASIAYVDIDSLNEKIVFIREKRKEMEAEQKAIEEEYIRGMRGLETQRDNFLKKGNSITQQEAEQFQGQLYRQQQVIEERKQNSANKLAEKSFKFMDDLQKNLKSFLKDYNATRNYTYILTAGSGIEFLVYKDSTLNITNDVISGMNDKLAVKK